MINISLYFSFEQCNSLKVHWQEGGLVLLLRLLINFQ